LNYEFSENKGYIESILISWDKSAHPDQYNKNRSICSITRQTYDDTMQWHCELCCYVGKCKRISNKISCCNCTCYTNVATDYSLPQVYHGGTYNYIWKTPDYMIVETRNSEIKL
jgi:hypothetical protein